MCRSPFMAALLQQWMPDVEISSAGFATPGRSVPEHAKTVAAGRGLDLSSHRSRAITREMVVGATLVVVMDARQAGYVGRALASSDPRVIVAGDLDPLNRDPRGIRDPWREPLQVFQTSYARLERCAAVLASELADKRVRQ